MKTVWKYHLETDDYTDLYMPDGATILTAGVQDGQIVIWALVDQTAKNVRRRFRVAGTGHPIGHDNLTYIGTINMKHVFWFHVFEVQENNLS